jgi:hypothetical protein
MLPSSVMFTVDSLPLRIPICGAEVELKEKTLNEKTFLSQNSKSHLKDTGVKTVVLRQLIKGQFDEWQLAKLHLL